MSAKGLHLDTGQMEYTALVWNVTPVFQHQALERVHVCFSVAARSLAAFTDMNSWFCCGGCFFLEEASRSYPQRLLSNKMVGGDECEMFFS